MYCGLEFMNDGYKKKPYTPYPAKDVIYTSAGTISNLKNISLNNAGFCLGIRSIYNKLLL